MASAVSICSALVNLARLPRSILKKENWYCVTNVLAIPPLLLYLVAARLRMTSPTAHLPSYGSLSASAQIAMMPRASSLISLINYPVSRYYFTFMNQIPRESARHATERHSRFCVIRVNKGERCYLLLPQHARALATPAWLLV